MAEIAKPLENQGFRIHEPQNGDLSDFLKKSINRSMNLKTENMRYGQNHENEAGRHIRLVNIKSKS